MPLVLDDGSKNGPSFLSSSRKMEEEQERPVMRLSFGIIFFEALEKRILFFLWSLLILDRMREQICHHAAIDRQLCYRHDPACQIAS
jgi:hypothetical protein